MDSIGYNGDVIDAEPSEISWGDLLNPRWKGRVAVFDDWSAGWLELGLAARALGLMEFGDIGNMTKPEMDGLAKILLELKKKGHFRAFWRSPDQALSLMSSGEVVIESMWPITAQALVAQGLPVRLATPVEGFRGWATGNAVSIEASRDPSRLQACYDLINHTYADGFGDTVAAVMRFGFYLPLQRRSRAFVDPGEYAYWIEGEPADKAYPGPLGQVSISKGQVREGGSLARRACTYGVWNSIFDESEHQLRRWEELVSA